MREDFAVASLRPVRQPSMRVCPPGGHTSPTAVGGILAKAIIERTPPLHQHRNLLNAGGEAASVMP
jgi:hypothetical protein